MFWFSSLSEWILRLDVARVVRYNINVKKDQIFYFSVSSGLYDCYFSKVSGPGHFPGNDRLLHDHREYPWELNICLCSAETRRLAWIHPNRSGLSVLFICRRQRHELCHEEIRNHEPGSRFMEDPPEDPADLFPGLSYVLVPLCAATIRWSLEPDPHSTNADHGSAGTYRSRLWYRFAPHLLSIETDSPHHRRGDPAGILDRPAFRRGY